MGNLHENYEKRNPFSAHSDIGDRFQVIFDAVNDGIFIVDPTTGGFTDVNQAACSMFGYNKTELIGCNIGMLSSGIHPYTLDISLEKGRSGEPQIFEWQGKTKDGVLFWIELSIRAGLKNLHRPISGVSA